MRGARISAGTRTFGFDAQSNARHLRCDIVGPANDRCPLKSLHRLLLAA
jgi:hypothetical protein